MGLTITMTFLAGEPVACMPGEKQREAKTRALTCRAAVAVAVAMAVGVAARAGDRAGAMLMAGAGWLSANRDAPGGFFAGSESADGPLSTLG